MPIKKMGKYCFQPAPFGRKGKPAIRNRMSGPHTREVYMVDTLRLATGRIGSHYKTSSNALANSLSRLSSGKKIAQPSDGIGEFIRIQRIRQDRRGYDEVTRNLARGTAMLNVAEAAGTEVVNGFMRLKEITELYHMGSTSSERKELYDLEFSTILVNMNTIKQAAKFDGKELMQSDNVLSSISLDPNGLDMVLEIKYAADQMFDTSGLAIDAGGSKEAAMALIDEQKSKAMAYLGQTSGYLRSVETQRTLVNAAVENGQAYESLVEGIDEGEELARMVTHEIRQQASISMLMHANVARQGVLKLLG